MSIFGPCSPSGAITDQEGVDLSEYAKTSYVDVQDSRRVLKAGDTMSGVLDMSGHLVRGLPTTNRRGDEAVSWSQAVRLTSDAAVTRVDKSGDTMSGDLDMRGNLVYGLPTDFPFSTGDAAVSRTQVLLEIARQAKKPIITVWAEESSRLNDNGYEWSFGDGASGSARRTSGYTMMAPGRVLRMGLATNVDTAAANIVVNGTENTAYGVTRDSTTKRFSTPLELAEGDVINFRSASNGSSITAAVVCVLIELDL